MGEGLGWNRSFRPDRPYKNKLVAQDSSRFLPGSVELGCFLPRGRGIMEFNSGMWSDLYLVPNRGLNILSLVCFV